MIDRGADPPIVKLSRQLTTAIGMFARYLVDKNDDDATRWVERQAALARPNRQLDEMRARMDAVHSAAERRPPLPVDAHADTRAERERMYREAEQAGRLRNWRE